MVKRRRIVFATLKKSVKVYMINTSYVSRQWEPKTTVGRLIKDVCLFNIFA